MENAHHGPSAPPPSPDGPDGPDEQKITGGAGPAASARPGQPDRPFGRSAGPAGAQGSPDSPDSPESLDLEALLASDPALAGLSLDRALAEDFGRAAHDLGLSREAAGNLAKMYARHQARQAEENQAAQARAMQEAEAAWLDELKADRDFPARLSRARAAIKAYGSPELTGILEETRLGSHPAFVRFMARVGQALAEPAFARSQAAVTEKSPAEVLYPNQGK